MTVELLCLFIVKRRLKFRSFQNTFRASVFVWEHAKPEDCNNNNNNNNNISAAARESGAAAETAASRKEEKYADLDGRYIFKPIAIDTLGVLNTSARQLLCDLGRKISGTRWKSDKRAFCFKDARCSCNVSMPYYFTTVYLPLTAPTDFRTHFLQPPQGHIYRESKNFLK